MSAIPIIHLITELDRGGAQTALYRLLAHTDRQRYAPRVLCLYNGDKVVAQQIRQLGIPVTDLGMTAQWRLDALWRLYQILRQERPSILHTWMFHANIPGRILGKLAGVPAIISSERTMGQEGRFRRWLNRLTGNMPDNIICVSQQVADFAADEIGLPPAKLTVIRNGVDITQFANLPDQQTARAEFSLPSQGRIIAAVGRPRPVKGFAYLLDAFAQIAAAYPDLYLVFVGDGPDKRPLQTAAQQLPCANRVLFLGDQQEIPRLLAGGDMLVLPSLWEGLPNVVLEAMAAGLPVVGTAVGGTPELISHNETGLLVPPQNSAALAAAISQALDQPEQAAQMGRNGRQRAAKQFTIERMTQQTEALYNRLLTEKNLHQSAKSADQ
jgi:sugar transferase (PEP-CTERM/EpsH1 system associated)